MKTGFPLAALMVLGIAWPRLAGAVAPTPVEMAEARRWAAAAFEGSPAAMPFFSFTYDGKPSAELLKTWDLKRASRQLDAQRVEHTLTHADATTGLVVRCVGIEYRDFPTVEWTLYFKNTSDRDTPILAGIEALDIQLERETGVSPPRAEFLLHHNTGSPTTPGDYGPRETTLNPETETRISAAGGRPTNSDLSYFNLELATGEGVILSVGWPGQWDSHFSRDKENGLRIRAGQELTHFKLLPGEEVRSPLVVLQFWKGEDWLRAQNVWRRWFIAHNIRRPGGQLPPIQWCGTSETATTLMTGATEENQKQFVDAYLERGLKPDFWWMDAGWYPCNGNWWQTGTWEPDKTRFPNGLRPVTDYLRAKGIRSILWFEPERVTPGSWLAENHPEWMLALEKGNQNRPEENKLLNLGDPAAWTWLVNHIDKMITESGIDIYRQDFNIDPLGYWRANDAEDRQGITEIRYVTGLLAYWDELLRRHPSLLFDNCASGGRRDDLESMRRGVPYCKSDYATDVVGVQGETYGISLWLPYFAATWDTREDAYSCRSRMAHVVGACLDIRNHDHFRKELPRRLEEWRTVAPYFWGDYWPLTPYSLGSKDWIAWQFNRAELADGVVQAFRRAESVQESARLRLRGLEQDAVYTLTNLDVAGTTEMTGRELQDTGLPIVIKDQPGATIITYRKKP
ncbi:MAG: alpha-galactosidase [Planctomycetia bacterium]|nr:alpha-galactosidase [Planctomycetia bacterium]